METRAVFDRLLQVRDTSRWAWDPLAHYLVYTAALCPFVLDQPVGGLNEFWLLQHARLSDSGISRRVHQRLVELVGRARENARDARSLVSEFREKLADPERLGRSERMGAGAERSLTLEREMPSVLIQERSMREKQRFDTLNARVRALVESRGKVGIVDIHMLAQLDARSDRRCASALTMDQYALLLSWILQNDKRLFLDIDMISLAEWSRAAYVKPVRWSWRLERSSMFVAVRGYSLHGKLSPRVRAGSDEKGDKRLFALNRHWGVARVVLLPQAGILRGVLLLNSLEKDAIDEAVRDAVGEVVETISIA